MMQSRMRQQQPAAAQQPPPPPTPAATGPGPGGGSGEGITTNRGVGEGQVESRNTESGPNPNGDGIRKGIPLFRSNRNSSSYNCRRSLLAVAAKVDTGRKVSHSQPEQVPTRPDGNSDLDCIDEDMFAKIPKMELLKVNYVNLKNDGVAGSEKKKSAVDDKKANGGTVAAAAPTKGVVSNAIKKQLATSSVNITNSNGNGSTSNLKDIKSKYLVYKKHNGFGSNNSIAEIGAKLQYINDSDVKMKNGKKKYAIFDTKKKSKLDTVQYYFDSRSYERYVDNKLYGMVNKDGQQSQQQGGGTGPQQTDSPTDTGDAHKRLSWDFRTNRPSMLRVINQSALSKMPTSESNPQLQQQTKGSTFKQQPHAEGNNRIFRLQKSHTSTNLITRHRSMNDIHRINQLFLESKATADGASQAPPSLPPLLSRQLSSSVIALNRKIVSKNPAPPAVTNSGVVRESVHRFEKNKAKNDEMSAKQQKYLVHKRLSTRYKAEESALSVAAATKNAAPVPSVKPITAIGPDDTISKRIRQIIDGHNGSGSTETINLESTKLEPPRPPHRVRSKSLERTLSDDDMSSLSVKSSKTTCGYKNCKFSNCPMSSSSSSSGSSTVSSSSCESHRQSTATAEAHKSCLKGKEPEIICGKRTSIVINDSDGDILLNNVINDKLNNSCENVRVISSKIKEIDLETNRMIIEKCIEPISDITETVLARRKFWNQQNQRNFKLNNNPQNKSYNDKIAINNKIKNEENNSIKIFITGSGITRASISEPVSLISTSTSGGSSAASTISSNGGESDKDDGYYDQSERSLSPAEKQPLSIVSTVSTSSTVCSDGTNMSSVTCSNGSSTNRYTSKTSIRLGCDGALFWNNNYFEDLDNNQSNVVVNKNDGCTAGSCCCCCRRRRSVALGNNGCLISSIDVGGTCSTGKGCISHSSGNGTGCNVVNGCVSGNGGGGVVLRKAQLCQYGMAKHNSKLESFSSRPRSIEGPPDSGISISSDTIIASSDSDLNLQSQTDSDERKLKRGHVLAELLETERIYVAEMGSILKGYRDEMLSEEMSSLVPPGLQGKADILFGNLHELYTFHNDIFLKDLENCISTTELVALCFVQRRDTFFRLYSYYCQNIPRSERLRETLVDTHLFLQECQKKLGHKLPLAAYLLKPVQRITKYQLLLKDLLKFSDTGTCSRELQKALDCMLVVLKCVNDSMHQIAITGFPADLSQQGELLMQDSFQVWTESKKDLRLRLKTQHRHIFLYQKAMLFCKQGSKTGHNKSTYQFKHWLQMSQIGLTESVRGDSRRFEVWLQGRQEVHTIQAGTVDIKNKWVAEIKRVLLNQLEELKGEKIKQYGLNHKPLRHTASWDMSPAMHGAPNRTFSCDQQPVSTPLSANNIQHHTGGGQDQAITKISHLSNEDSILSAAGISSSSSEHDNQETNAWSSDYSNSEDEFTHGEDGVLPGHKFVSLADYCAMGNSEVSMKDGDIVELLKIGCAGWWFVKVIGNNLEGWAPAAFLEPINRKASRLRSARSQDKLNEH
ncbi:serine-rich adhesin for platelets isoform X1 [Wyeomyia smithii]|uniref:serine-rich adhesin for platelets isoform X1 n=1 Tax=Wyeomyia smithii TaxID=174621 RepID=UPI002467E6CC|nr:serine-rich adhesin for platelets isoform X1 [Wyeomyia smithii]